LIFVTIENLTVKLQQSLVACKVMSIFLLLAFFFVFFSECIWLHPDLLIAAHSLPDLLPGLRLGTEGRIGGWEWKRKGKGW